MGLDRRKFLVVSALTPLAITAATASAAETSHRFGFGTGGDGFLLDGKPFQIRSGEMHPARIPQQYWRHRIRMAKAMGMNTVSLYVMWNYHEERPGVFDFSSERRDIERFIRLCQAEGMWVLLRPGPYVCGEWDLGGIPPYLLRYPDIKLRVGSAIDARYMTAVKRYLDQLIPRVKPLMTANGGPILMIQIENEYGSYGADVGYLEELKEHWIDGGIPGPFYTEDGIWQLQQHPTVVGGGAVALSGGDVNSIATARSMFPAVPAMAGEVYPGWLTHWGDPAFQGTDWDISATLKGFMDQGRSFNIYMLHGGTSFGFFAGANADDWSGRYTPDITSYDYSAPITEQGGAGVRYAAYRDIIGSSLPVPAPIPTIAGDVPTPKPYASIWDNLPAPLTAATPQPFEMYGQNSGFALYRTTLPAYQGGALDIRWVHDYATVFVDGEYRGGLSRVRIPDEVSAALNVTNDNQPLTLAGEPAREARLDIFVEGMGRTNFGQAIVDRKGILESVTLGSALTGWQIYPLPMDDEFVATLKPGKPGKPGTFFKTTVRLKTVGDTYVDLSGWTKGVVWVNGHNLGRYWAIGPQHRLYCPAPWLRTGVNEILVFDLHQTEAGPISLQHTLA